jgi:PadR family transcriptional regulator, regulatory protein PadR
MMYGYQIRQKVKEITNDKIDISEGSLYPILHKLEATGVVETSTVEIGKRARKYYKLSQSGQAVAREKIEELGNFINSINLLMNPNLAI